MKGSSSPSYSKGGETGTLQSSQANGPSRCTKESGAGAGSSSGHRLEDLDEGPLHRCHSPEDRWNFRFDPSYYSCNTKRGGDAATTPLPDPIGYHFVTEPTMETTTAGSSRPASSSLSFLLKNAASEFTGASSSSSFSPPSSSSLRHRRLVDTTPQSPSAILRGDSSSSPAAAPLTVSNYEILLRRSWEASISPLKSFGMTFFMMYMSGASSGIFGILIIGYALASSVNSLLAVGSVFAPYDGVPNSLILQKLVYILLSLGGLTYVLYYCHSLGLLPLNSGDYIGLIPEKRIVEKSYHALFF